jgi:ferric iron reductase protein FhuF
MGGGEKLQMLNVQMSSFNPEELQILTNHFRLSPGRRDESPLCVAALELLDPEKCEAYLEQAAGIFQTSAKAAAASQFSKRYAYLTMASGLYAMTMFNKGMNYAIENCHIESVFKDRTWLPEVSLADRQVTMPAAEDREQWRDQILRSVFADNIAKVWRSISKAARIPVSILWENMAISVYWLYEQRMGEEATEEQKRQIQADFYYLLHEAPGHLFGEEHNPLTRYNNPEKIITDSNIFKRKRKTCCLYYKVSEKHDFCTTCPLRKE